MNFQLLYITVQERCKGETSRTNEKRRDEVKPTRDKHEKEKKMDLDGLCSELGSDVSLPSMNGLLNMNGCCPGQGDDAFGLR